MKHVKMMRGLPASGKTTMSRELVRGGGFGRVNRDDLRAMLFDSVWSGFREGIVVEVEKAIARILLKHNLNPVIDDTNLTPKHEQIWSEFAADHKIGFEIEQFHVDLHECVRRDWERAKPIGEAVIFRMALNNGLIHFPDKPIVIFDLDGTTFNGEAREHHVAGPKKDWDTYFSLMGEDKPVDIVVRWIRELYKTHTILLVSGRPDNYQFLTVESLDRHEIPYHYLFMRPAGSRQPDTEIKKAILDKLPKEKISFVVDDRISVIKMWRENGLKVFSIRCQDRDFE